ncbi:MAG TPA: diguanylate cyclase [Steroidobacteraceae bacterium]|nr:diguanylate cyclase [Steroidobacteraceae bacterium]
MISDDQAADVDHLTGLPMGASLDALTLDSWESATTACGAMAVLLVELDDFERYCDNYGAAAGELLLRRVSTLLCGSGVRASDRAGRVTGAQFLLVLPGASLDAAQIPAERILRAVRDLEIPNRGSTISNYVTVSIGAASCRPQPGDSMVTLVDAGASALWSAKQRGQNRIAAYELSPNVPQEEAVLDVMHVG